MKKVLGTIIRKPALLLGLLAVVVLAGGLVLAMISSRKSSENRSQAANTEAHPRFYFAPEIGFDANPATKDVLEMVPSTTGAVSTVGKFEIKMDVSSEPVIAVDLQMLLTPESVSRLQIVNFVPNSGLFAGVSQAVPVTSDGRLRLVLATNPGLTVSGSGRNLGNLQLTFKPPAVAGHATLSTASIAITSAKVVTPTRVIDTIVNPAGHISLDGMYKGTLALKYVLPNQASSRLGTCGCENGTVVSASSFCAPSAKPVCVASNACACVQSISCKDLRMTDINRNVINQMSPGQTVGFKFTMNPVGQSPSDQWDAQVKITQVKTDSTVSEQELGYVALRPGSRIDPYNPSTLVQDLPFTNWTNIVNTKYFMNFRHPITITTAGVNSEYNLWCNSSSQWQIIDAQGAVASQYTVPNSTSGLTYCSNNCAWATAVSSGTPQPSPTPTGPSSPTATPTPITCPICQYYQPSTQSCVNVANDTRCYASTGSISCLNGQCAPATATPTPTTPAPVSATNTPTPTKPAVSKTPTPFPTLIFD